MNTLYYGDNLEVLRKTIEDESVDLVYLDPPFNSNRAYNVIFGRHPHSGNGAAAQIQAFDDTWRWTPLTDQQYQHYVAGRLPTPVSDALMAFRTLLGENDCHGLPRQHGTSVSRASPGAEAHRLSVPALRSHHEPLPEDSAGCDLRS